MAGIVPNRDRSGFVAAEQFDQWVDPAAMV
jgi:hypothetical protein